MDNNIVLKIEKEPPVKIEVRSNIGGRQEQQDFAYILSRNDMILFMLCDGMGGTENGGQASRLAAETMCEYLSKFSNAEGPDILVPALEDALRLADSRVAISGARKSGTTVVTVLIKKDQLYWASVGDSRLYIFRHGELVQTTRDHNYLLELDKLWSEGYLTEEKYKAESMRGQALISYIGKGKIELFDLTEDPMRLQKDDILLLTTDGLYSVVPSEIIKDILDSDLSLGEMADGLMRNAMDKSAEYVLDNTTFILIKV